LISLKLKFHVALNQKPKGLGGPKSSRPNLGIHLFQRLKINFLEHLECGNIFGS